MYTRTIAQIVSTILIVSPCFASAAPVNPPQNFAGLVGIITNLIGTLVLVIFSLTFLAFAWNIIKHWIIEGGDAEGVETGKKVLFASVIALVIMSSIWGILKLLQSSFFGGL